MNSVDILAGHTEAAPTIKVEAVATLVIGAVALVMLGVQVVEVWANAAVIEWGADYIIYRDAAARWLEGGGFYMPHQLAGPYEVVSPVVLYPPPSLVLFVPFVFLPAVLWWVLPIGITAWAAWKHRPRPIGWAVILFCLANPTTISALVWGNPALWLVAGLALGTHYGWPSVVVLLKPTLFPFAMFGIWKRSWWLALGLGGLVSLAFLPMWSDYVTVLMNSRGPSGWFGYSTAQIPMMLLPVVAWVTRAAGPAGWSSWRSERRTSGDPAPQP